MIANLTGLRFYMALWVMLYHIESVIQIPIISDIIKKGYLGVDVFFVLSGYILTHVYYRQFTNEWSGKTYRSFLQKRVARIYPLHFITIIGAVILLSLLSHLTYERPLYLDHLPYQFLMVHSWGFLKTAQLNYPSWSISAEWFAYLFVFPLFVWLYNKSKWLIYLLIVLVLFLMQMAIFNYYGNDFGQTLGIGIIRITPEFLIGCTAYLALKHKSGKELALCTFGPLILGLVGWSLTSNLDHLIIGFIPTFIILLHQNDKLFNPLFGSRLFVWLGEISYAMYMTHFFAHRINGIIHDNFLSSGGKFVYVICYVGLTLVFSVLSYYLIEMPARKWISRLKIG